MPGRWDLLENADWSSLDQMYVPPIDVAHLLRAVWSEDPRVRSDVYDRLADALGGGSPCEAHAVAAQFLIDVVADPDAPDRFAACQILVTIAVRDQASWLSSPPDLATARRDVQRRAGMAVEELEQEQVAWVAAAPTEERRQARASRVAHRCGA